MRNLHCLLVSILLLIGKGLPTRSAEVKGKIPGPFGPPIFTGISKLNILSGIHIPSISNINLIEQLYLNRSKYPCHNRVMIV
jgi:hypothetical protein